MRMPAWLFTLLAAAFVLYTDDRRTRSRHDPNHLPLDT